ncbi:MAG: glycosyltransferase [Candidatus Zixiibacteriota bacterium]|nr:MAG: glycosyltransferase [candidate division Zixibacteria bacterium]
MSRTRLRVLLLADAGSVHVERFTRQLKRQECHVVTASLEEGTMHHVRLKRLGPVRSFHYLLAVPQLKGIIKRFKPDIVNAHYASGYGLIGAEAIGSGGPPMVLNLWGSDILVVPDKSPQHRRKSRIALERAAWVFGDSRFIITCAEKIGRMKHNSVLPWGIEREYLNLHRADYAFSKPMRIIVPRSHEETYNNEFILQALRPLVERGEVALTFPAFGSMFEQFKTKAGKLADWGVQLYEKTDRRRFLAFMAEHDVYLSSSRSDSSPASMIEAMALGLIPVAADIDGVKEWLSPETGFAFEQGNQDNLREVITAIAGGGPLDEMRRRNLERVKAEAIFEDNVGEQVRIMYELAGADFGA